MGNFCTNSSLTNPIVKCDPCDLEIFNQETNKIKLVWITDKPNSQIINLFQSVFIFKVFPNIHDAKAIFNSKEKYDIIIPDILEKEDYDIIQNSNAIQNMWLINNNNSDDGQMRDILSNYNKVDSADFNIRSLLKKIRFSHRRKVKQNKYRVIACKTLEDDHMTKKVRFNYNWMLSKNDDHELSFSKNDLVELFQLYPEDRSLIPHFQDILSNSSLMLKQATKDNAFWLVISQLPCLTTSPQQLAYLRFMYQSLFNEIKKQYQQKKKRIDKLYIVTKLSDQDVKMLNSDVIFGNKKKKPKFIMFNTFIKGFTEQDKAKSQQKLISNSYIFQIDNFQIETIPELEKGYYIYDSQNQDIIINILNYFHIDNIHLDQKIVQATFQGIARVEYMKQNCNNDQKSRMTFIQEYNQFYFSNNYIEWIMMNSNQATSLALQGYQDQKLCIKYYDNYHLFFSQLNNIQKLEQNQLNRANYYLKMNQFDKSQKILLRLQKESQQVSKTYLCSLLNLAELYYRKGDIKNFEAKMNAIKPNMKTFEKVDKFEAIQAMNYISILLMERKQYGEGKNNIQSTINKLVKLLDNKVEGNPIYNDCLRNKAVCLSNQRNHNEALELLKSVTETIKKSQGSSNSLRRTQILVKLSSTSNLQMTGSFARITREKQN